MNFGYGAGDVLALTSLAVQVYKAVHDGPKEYRHLLDDVSTMRVVLEQMEHLYKRGMICNGQKENFQTVTDGCERDLIELQGLVAKYQAAAPSNASTGVFKGILKKAKLGMIVTEDSADLRRRMTLHTVSLATIVGIHTSSNPKGRLEFSDTEVLVVVLGPTGSGKSSFVQMASGRDDVLVGHTLQSTTEKFQAVRFERQGVNFTLIDCPGFDDTSRPDFELILELANYLEVTFRAQFLLSGVIYMHRMIDSRITGSTSKNLRYLRKLCGTQSFRKIAFVTSFWDEVAPEIAERRERELKQNYWSEDIKHGAVVRRFAHDRQSALSILQGLAGKSRVVLDIQKELAVEEKPFGQTSIGQQLVQDTEYDLRNLQRDAQMVHEEKQDFNAKHDDIRSKQLEEEIMEIRDKLRQKCLQLEKLR